MKKILTVALIIVLSLVVRSYARDFYLSIAPTISLENFDLEGLHEIIDKDRSLGFNFKFGHRINQYLLTEFDFDFINGFQGYLTQNDIISLVDIQIETAIPIFRAEVGSDYYKNYFSTGIGYMYADIGESLSDAVWKLGIGFDYLMVKSLALEGQINYVVGLGKVKFIEYYNAALGLRYLF